jgi:CubicO group peptidase (beta-lactamase class C family)
MTLMRLMAALALTFAAAAAGSAQSPPPPAATISVADLAGIWSGELRFGPAVGGPLTLRRTGNDWEAEIAGTLHRFSAAGPELRFTLSDGRGDFRGTLARGGRTLEGFWIQPGDSTEGRLNRGGTGGSFSTPLTLTRAGRDVWRGEVVPLDDRFTGYIQIAPEDDGFAAALRNPQLNLNGGASRYRVERNGDALRFSFHNEDYDFVHEATLLHDPERIRIVWPGLGLPLELSRRDVATSAFFPRPRTSAHYAYRRPEQLNDGWTTANAAEVGIDQAALTRLIQELIDADPAMRGPSLIHSVLVARRGRLVLEEYFFGQGREAAHDLRSAGKTFSSVLLGVAMHHGAPISPDSPAYEVMRERGPFANPDPRKSGLLLRHLMTHSSGLACNDNDEASPGNEDTLWQQPQADFWKYTLDLPMLHPPGTRYAYCSASINLAGGMIATATRSWVPRYFHDQVAVPLQFGRYHWLLSPDGEGYLGGGVFMQPRDLLKIGQTWLNGGTWNGRRIVDQQWIARSTTPLMDITPQTTGLSEEDFGNYYGGGRDALAWHTTTLTAGGRTYSGYLASGNGGQLLVVLPELDLAAVITGGNYRQGGIWSRWPQRLIGDAIIPALRD